MKWINELFNSMNGENYPFNEKVNSMNGGERKKVSFNEKMRKNECALKTLVCEFSLRPCIC